jgi:hypothetical protein
MRNRKIKKTIRFSPLIHSEEMNPTYKKEQKRMKGQEENRCGQE